MKNESDTVELVLKKTMFMKHDEHFSESFSPISIVLALVIASCYVVYNYRRAHLVKLMNKIPGPPSLPIIGNTVEVNVEHDGNSFLSEN